MPSEERVYLRHPEKRQTYRESHRSRSYIINVNVIIRLSNFAVPTTSNLVPRPPLHVCSQGNISHPWPFIDKDDKVQRLNNSVDLQIVFGSIRDFLQDSLLENPPPSEGGDSDPWFGRQRRHRPMGTPVLPGVAAVPYR